MYIFRYFIAIPSNRQRQHIREVTLEMSRMARPYAVGGNNITYYPNVFALAVL